MQRIAFLLLTILALGLASCNPQTSVGAPPAQSAADLPKAGTEAAKQLASSLRLSTTGVRAKVKLK